MPWQKHSDECPDCRPCLIDTKLGTVLPPDDPRVVAMNKVWSETTMQEREAFHNFTCLRDQSPTTMRLVRALQLKMQEALK